MNSYRGPVAQILDVNEAQVLPRCFFRAAARPSCPIPSEQPSADAQSSFSFALKPLPS